MRNHSFLIADWVIHLVSFEETTVLRLIPSFRPFYQGKECCSSSETLLTITIDQNLPLEKDDSYQRIKICETGNSIVVVDRNEDGAYRFLIKNLQGEDCALLQSNKDFSQCRCRILGNSTQNQSFGLSNAILIAFAFAGATRGTLLIHASLVRHAGIGYAFIAKSGTGKSTQTSNWLKMIPDCDLMNDDNPVLRVIEGNPVIYGSPWSGKTPCYRQVKAPLGAITKIVRDSENHVEPLNPIIGFSELLSSCSVMKWDKPTYHGICDTVTSVIECTPVYNLYCTADPISAKVCYEAIRPDR